MRWLLHPFRARRRREAEYTAALLETGVITRDEARQRFGLGPYPASEGGDR